jgi:stage II sporulation protein M
MVSKKGINNVKGRIKWVNLKRFSLKREYIGCFNFLKGTKKFLNIIIGVFVFFAFVGLFFPVPVEISQRLLDYFSELILQTEGFGAFEMIWFLFKNNLFASFFGLIFGILFGVFSIFNAIVNGFVLGFVSRLSVVKNGIFSLWRLFPHGIFEIPALFISLALGLRLGMSLIGVRDDKFGENFKWSLKTFFLVVVPLLVIAAVIEGVLIVFS